MSNPASEPITQNSQTNNAKYVSIIPENGTEFSPSQKIIFNLDPSLGWIKGRDSYLVFDIENVGASPLPLTLAQGGISSIIKQVNIFSQQNGMLLETLDDYNQWTATELQYRNDDPNNVSNIEGCPKYLQPKSALAPSNDDVKLLKNWHNNNRDVQAHRLTQIKDDATPQITPVRFTTPLRCGIFRHWDDETLVPILQMGGLRIELVLADPVEALDMPFSGRLNADKSQGGHWAKAVNYPMKCDDFVNNATTLTLADPVLAIKDCGLIVGQTITVNYTQVGTATAITLDRQVTAIAQNGTKIDLTLTALTPAPVVGSVTAVIADSQMTQANINYKVRNAEFRLLQEMPPNTKMANMDYVFTSYDLFRDTIPKSQTNFNQDITSVASKAVSLFTMYENPFYDALVNFPNGQYHQGTTPDETGINMNSIVYFINNKLYPLRAYNPSRYGDRVINQNELVKAFGTLNFAPKCLGSSKNADLGEYTNRYLHGRELARGDSVFNLQNAEPQIRLGFSAGRGDDDNGNAVGNLRMKTFVFSKKILHIDGDAGLSLEH